MAQTLSVTTLATLSANGQTSSIPLDAHESEVTIYLGTGGANFGLGTLIIQESFDGGTTWLSHPTVSWASGTAGAFLGKAIVNAPLIRLSLSGATSPTLIPTVKVAALRYTRAIPGQVINPITFAANGTSSTFLVNGLSLADSRNTLYGDIQIPWAAQGTWGSGTLALQSSPDGVNWFQVDTATANVKKLTRPVTDSLFRFVLSGATNPALTIWVVE
ncbi:MAG: hypothetical protein KGI54_08345 [Pseudomonadota bacterium]|nr:hypothetical protein [Pseudomonadota bacterium]